DLLPVRPDEGRDPGLELQLAPGVRPEIGEGQARHVHVARLLPGAGPPAPSRTACRERTARPRDVCTPARGLWKTGARAARRAQRSASAGGMTSAPGESAPLPVWPSAEATG